MKVLVTGANGLLGANLIKELVGVGEKVVAFVRPSSDIRVLESMACDIFYGDILNYQDISKAVAECSCIVHAASTTSVLPRDFAFYKKINVEATENIIQAALRYENKKLVYVSTANTFRPGTKERPGTELSDFSLGHYHSGYINSKQMAQQCVLEAVKNQGLNATVVNPTFIVGPYDVKPSSGKLMLFGLRRGIQWCPEGGKNFVYAGDVAKGIYQALLTGRSGECYLLAGKNLTYKEFFTLLNETTGRRPIQLKPPKNLIRAAGSVVDLWSRVSRRKFAFTKENAELLTLDNYYDGTKASQELKLSTTPIKEAIKEALDWFKKENYVSKDNYSIHGTNLDL
jgi:dihydroflavonol-4-reductase